MKEIFILTCSLMVTMPTGCNGRKTAMHDFNISIKTPTAAPVTEVDLRGLRTWLPVLPVGYQDYMLQYGCGTTGDDLTILTPRMILGDGHLGIREQKKFREEYWFWDEYGYAKDFFLNAVPIASDSLGDIYLVLPNDPNTIYRLEHEGGVRITKNGIIGLIEQCRKDWIGEDRLKDWYEFKGSAEW